MRSTVPTLHIPARARTYVYALYGILALAVVLIQVGYASIEAPHPEWLTILLATVPVLGVGIGYTAASHVPAAPDAQGQPVAELDPYAPAPEDDGAR